MPSRKFVQQLVKRRRRFLTTRSRIRQKNVFSAFENLFEFPNKEEYSEVLGKRGNSLSYGVSSIQGKRPDMADTHVESLSVAGNDGLASFCVFDGWGGERTSNFLKDNLLQEITKAKGFNEIDFDTEKGVMQFKDILVDKFLEVDETIDFECGSTANLLFASNKYLITANAGDSRLAICKAGEVMFETTDHKPYSVPEKERILSAGGFVQYDRIDGILAVSRGFGARRYKQAPVDHPFRQKVSVEPEVNILPREDGQYAIMASDGFWDVFTAKQGAKIVTSELEENTEKFQDESEYGKLANSMAVFARDYRGSMDNITITLVFL